MISASASGECLTGILRHIQRELCSPQFVQFRFVLRDDVICPIQQVDYTLPGRLSAGPQLQVFQPIVVSFAIDMVDIFVAVQWTLQMTFHHIAMFGVPVITPSLILAKVSRAFDFDVTVFQDIAGKAISPLLRWLYRCVHVPSFPLPGIMDIAQLLFTLFPCTSRPLTLADVPNCFPERRIYRYALALSLPVQLTPSICSGRTVAFVVFAGCPII
jgi:hypothetical protein